MCRISQVPFLTLAFGAAVMQSVIHSCRRELSGNHQGPCDSKSGRHSRFSLYRTPQPTTSRFLLEANSLVSSLIASKGDGISLGHARQALCRWAFETRSPYIALAGPARVYGESSRTTRATQRNTVLGGKQKTLSLSNHCLYIITRQSIHPSVQLSLF